MCWKMEISVPQCIEIVIVCLFVFAWKELQVVLDLGTLIVANSCRKMGFYS